MFLYQLSDCRYHILFEFPSLPSNVFIYLLFVGGRCGSDRMVVGFTTTCAISAHHHKFVSSNPVHGEVYSIQHYMIKFVSGFLRALRFPPPVKPVADWPTGIPKNFLVGPKVMVHHFHSFDYVLGLSWTVPFYKFSR